jgi:hypothetical protein
MRPRLPEDVPGWKGKVSQRGGGAAPPSKPAAGEAGADAVDSAAVRCDAVEGKADSGSSL